MKKIIVLLLSFVICLSLCSCSPLSNSNALSYNDDASKMYYNGYTYYNNSDGKYRFDLEKDTDNWVEIATMPYGFFYIWGAVTVYYGNDAEKPDFITNSRTIDFYVREDVSFNHSLMLSVCDTAEPFRFRISDVITGNVITYNIDEELDTQRICNFFAEFEDYPSVQLWIDIYEINGKLYLQEVWNSDYYEITDAFKEDLYKFGVNTFDYH